MTTRVPPSSAKVLAPVVVIALAAAVLVLRSRQEGGSNLGPGVGVVEWVIDGDTVDIEIAGAAERVRLIGIDTPETHTDTGVPECYGPEAFAFTRSLLPVGTEVRLVRDVVGRDDYGRLLAYVFRRNDDLFVNETVIGGGYARPLSIGPNTAYRERFVAVATAAEAAERGLWAACGG